jgi:hypothetical protein
MPFDEFPWNVNIPWKEALASACALADETIIVLGGRKHIGSDTPVRKHLATFEHKHKCKVIDHVWPEDWSWMQIAHALNMGLLHSSGKWVFRLLMDEFFPLDQVPSLRSLLDRTKKDVVWAGRHYIAGKQAISPYLYKPFFFRRAWRYAYGRVKPDGDMPLMFDNPVELNIPDAIKMRFAYNAAYLKRFRLPPLGTREEISRNAEMSAFFILNSDVSFYSKEELITQKIQSQEGYARLPDGYKKKNNLSAKNALESHLQRLQSIFSKVGVTEYQAMPECLQNFMAARADPEKYPVASFLSKR